MKHAIQSPTRLWQKPEFVIFVLYFITASLVLAPYYNYFYRIGVIFLNYLAFPLTLFSFLLVFTRACLKNHEQKRALLLIGFSLLTLFIQSQLGSWRYAITDFYLQHTSCNMNGPIEEMILGGITEIRFEASSTETGAFENSTHCLGIVCAEEFYYCNWSQIRIGP